jgi:hypothetical protein
MFGQSLATKSLWNTFTKESLWRRILIQNYITHGTVMDWIRRERKIIHNASNQWIAMTLAFPSLESWQRVTI